MNSAQSTDQSFAVAVNKFGRNVTYSLEYGALRIYITQEGIGNSGRRQKCGNC